MCVCVCVWGTKQKKNMLYKKINAKQIKNGKQDRFNCIDKI